MQDLIGQLLQYGTAAWRRRWYGLIVAWVVCLVGWLVVERIPDRFQSSAQVYINTDSMLRPLMQGIAADLNTGVLAQLDIVRRTILTRPNLEQVMRMADLDVTANSVVESERIMASLRSRLTIDRGGREDLFSVSFVDENPKVAYSVVQALLTLFVETNLGANRQDLERTQKFLNDQISGLEQKVGAAENALSTFEIKNRGFLPGQGSFEDRLNDAQLRSVELKAKLREATSIRDELNKQLAQFSREGVATDALAEKRARIDELERSLTDLRTRYTEDHPDVVITKRLLEREKLALEEADKGGAGSTGAGWQRPSSEQIRLQLAQQNGTIISLEELSKQVDADISRLKDLVTQMPEIVTEYARLKREYEVIRGNLEALTGRRESARFAEEVDTKTEQVQFRIVEPPNTPVTPQGPNRPVLRAGVLAGGLGAGAAFCVLLALIAGTFTNAQRLQEIFQRPVIGVISRLSMPSARRLQALELTCFTLVCSGLVGVFYLVLLGAVKALPDIMIQRLMSI